MRCRIQEAFDGFVVKVFPADLGERQRVDLQRTFFAGAVALYGIVMSGLSAGSEIEPEDLQMMGDLQAEMRRFSEEVKREAP